MSDVIPYDLAQVELDLNAKFGFAGWEINPYLSPAEKAINKPILPVTDRGTNRMGHARNWPGPDTALVQAVFYDYALNEHTFVFTHTDDAITWLYRQDPSTLQVVS